MVEGGEKKPVVANGKPKIWFDSIEAAMRDLAEGKFLLVVDNEDRENEGDLVIAAEKVTTEKMAFMKSARVKFSGLICVPATSERLDQLKLPLMVPQNTEKMKTAYTISVDYRHSLQPVGVICELVRDDGSMARRDDCRAFADEHGLKLITIEDIVKYRLEKGLLNI
ncbi:13988_t:CDS:2 [Acaulospora colombiana]|uniref:13988_t:CDS:1 n=1 Tax=Acaulospora colombiana TaxID=27376 RepID=A0ACA9KGE4_9GLOM|nr:13988_t:CDS:2 [Acaulospora colombiana]